jgi:hypothetical protein
MFHPHPILGEGTRMRARTQPHTRARTRGRARARAHEGARAQAASCASLGWQYRAKHMHTRHMKDAPVAHKREPYCRGGNLHANPSDGCACQVRMRTRTALTARGRMWLGSRMRLSAQCGHQQALQRRSDRKVRRLMRRQVERRTAMQSGASAEGTPSAHMWWQYVLVDLNVAVCLHEHLPPARVCCVFLRWRHDLC